jgi:hypothetical protein
MDPIKIKIGFPNVSSGDTVCPFCGGVNGDVEGVYSSHYGTVTYASVKFGCMSGCYWELRLESDAGEIPAAQCVLLELDTELLRASFWGSITDWVHLQKNLISDDPARPLSAGVDPWHC